MEILPETGFGRTEHATHCIYFGCVRGPDIADPACPGRDFTATPQQREAVKATNVKFTACHNKAMATKVAPPDRRAFMKNCLAGG